MLYLFTYGDTDLTLFLYEKFGSSSRKDSLKNKVVWITGASSGIGESLCYDLAKCQCKLVLSGRNKERLEKVKDNCINLGVPPENIMICAFEIEDLDQHQDIFNKIISNFEKIDILVNNAGRAIRSTFEKIDIRVDKSLFDINVFGPINLSRIVLNHWYQNQLPGHIVINSSMSGKVAFPNSSTYDAVKFSLHAYFDSLRLEAYKKNINITLVCFGPVHSNVIENSATGTFGDTYGFKASKGKRMETARASYLMLLSIIHNLDEVWISEFPFLFFVYMFQYFPSISRLIFAPLFNSKLFVRARDGGSKE